MCQPCDLNAEADQLPVRERVYLDPYWRVAHGWSSLPGWLIIVLRRHVESMDQLTAEEAATLGSLLRAASIALKQVVGCEKTYAMLFAERPGYAHIHVHVVPKMSWFTDDDRSAAAFRFLNLPEAEQVGVEERDRLAVQIGASMAEVLQGLG
jgi:diadenosine tetraphosphate (Ap4A) HIT family hydrolase